MTSRDLDPDTSGYSGELTRPDLYPEDGAAPPPRPTGAVRALRLGLLAAAVFLAGSVGWDLLVAPDKVYRLLVVRGLGVVFVGVIAALTVPFGRRAKVLGAAAAAVVAMSVCAAVVVLPYGFAYGIGGMLFIALSNGLVHRDGRSALVAGAAALAGAAVTLLGYRVPWDTVWSIAFFAVPGMAFAVVTAHSTGVRRERERSVRVAYAALREDLARFGANDALTGVHDSKQLTSLARREIALARRRKSALSAIKIDIDALHQINDTYGRPAGDETLRAVASMCQATLRETDLLARVDGDEFAAVLPEADSAGAETLCDRLQKSLEKASVLAGDRVLQVSVSVGSATLVEGDHGIDDLLKRAEESLKTRRTSRLEPSPAKPNGANGKH